MPLPDDDFLVFFNYHLSHLEFVGLETIVFHEADVRHDIEFGFAGRLALAGQDVDVYRLVVVGVELESQSEENKQKKINSSGIIILFYFYCINNVYVCFLLCSTDIIYKTLATLR